MDVDLFPIKGKVVSEYVTKTHAELEVSLHSFISSALDGGECSTS
jgi:hypothetical protein